MNAMDGETVARGLAPDAVRVVAPARLHLGLLDMNGALGRRYGSIGLAVDAPSLAVRLSLADRLETTGPEAERTGRLAATVAGILGEEPHLSIAVESAIPAHAGFGSGTQLALAITAGMAALSGRRPDLAAVGARLDRGARSGIGVAAFAHGGFIVDGGRGPAGGVPPVIARLAFPEDWRIVLLLDRSTVGVHGAAEAEAFRSLPPFPDRDAADLCRLVMMRLLPGLAETDVSAVGAALTEIQERLGDHFAPAQGGHRFASPRVAGALDAARALGAAGVGQSSWGPTGFALLSDADAAATLVGSLRAAGHLEGLEAIVARGRNRGASILPA